MKPGQDRLSSNHPRLAREILKLADYGERRGFEVIFNGSCAAYALGILDRPPGDVDALVGPGGIDEYASPIFRRPKKRREWQLPDSSQRGLLAVFKNPLTGVKIDLNEIYLRKEGVEVPQYDEMKAAWVEIGGRQVRVMPPEEMVYRKIVALGNKRRAANGLVERDYADALEMYGKVLAAGNWDSEYFLARAARLGDNLPKVAERFPKATPLMKELGLLA
ncbi:MAG: hypothetical protein V1820_03050 [archaeon]